MVRQNRWCFPRLDERNEAAMVSQSNRSSKGRSRHDAGQGSGDNTLFRSGLGRHYIHIALSDDNAMEPVNSLPLAMDQHAVSDALDQSSQINVAPPPRKMCFGVQF